MAMTTMQPWISKHLSLTDLAEIEAAIASVETKTSGEVVPMIVRRSVSLRSAPYIAIMAALSLLFVLALIFQFDFARTDHLVGLVIGVVAALGLAVATPFLIPLQKFFTLDGDEDEAAFERAQLEFYQTGIPATEGRTGVLIFVSLFERRAFILGDESISKRLNQEVWVEITQAMVNRFKQKDFKGAFVGAIEAVGTKLATEFPRAANDRNELHDHLIIKE
ncbi:MAG: TPM domain-containing protein [Bdellovibrionota bacterium]